MEMFIETLHIFSYATTCRAAHIEEFYSIPPIEISDEEKYSFYPIFDEFYDFGGACGGRIKNAQLQSN